MLTIAGRRLGDPVAGWIAAATTATAFGLTVAAFTGMLARPGDERAVSQRLFTWIAAGDLRVDAGLLADPLSVTMAMFVTGVGAAITLYAIGYMRGDDRFPAFFAYLSLFVFSMLVLVLADSFPVMFVGWEGVGSASWMPISFWFTRDRAAVAAKKASIVNRIGDVGFLLAMFVVLEAVGSLSFGAVFEAAPGLTRGSATAAALLFLLGAVGKSAQLPLYLEELWIRDVTINTGLVDTYATPTLLRLVTSHQLDPSRFATHHFALEEFMDAYDVFARGGDTGALKVVVSRDRAASS